MYLRERVSGVKWFENTARAPFTRKLPIVQRRLSHESPWFFATTGLGSAINSLGIGVGTAPLLYAHYKPINEPGWYGYVSVTNLSHYTDQDNDLKTSSFHGFGVGNDSEKDIQVEWKYTHEVFRLFEGQELFWARDSVNGHITVKPGDYRSSGSIDASPTRSTCEDAQEGNFVIKAYTSIDVSGADVATAHRKDEHERYFIQDGGG